MTSIRNPKIAVIGATDEELTQIKALLAEKNIDLVELEDEADAVVDANWVLGERLSLNLPKEEAIPTDCTEHHYDDGKQHWRGGSRGKGGKIKYKRK